MATDLLLETQRIQFGSTQKGMPMMLKRTLTIAAAAVALVLWGCRESIEELDIEARPAPQTSGPLELETLLDELSLEPVANQGVMQAPLDKLPVNLGKLRNWAMKHRGRWVLESETLGHNAYNIWIGRGGGVLDIFPQGESVGWEQAGTITLEYRPADGDMELAFMWYRLLNIDFERSVAILYTSDLAPRNFFSEAGHGEISKDYLWQLHEVGFEFRYDKNGKPVKLFLRTHTAWGRKNITVWIYEGPTPTE